MSFHAAALVALHRCAATVSIWQSATASDLGVHLPFRSCSLDYYLFMVAVGSSQPADLAIHYHNHKTGCCRRGVNASLAAFCLLVKIPDH